MPRQLFSRIGMTVRIPVSATSGTTKFATTGKLPMDVQDLTFIFVNRLPCDVRLEGFSTEAAFQSVTEDSGWPILARSTFGVFTSKRPMFMSAQAFASPGLALPVEGQDGWSWANCYLELIYGRGE